MAFLARVIPRLDLPELMDLEALPARLRAGEVRFLRALHHRMAVHEVVVDAVAAALDRVDTPRIVDLCAGGGGPSIDLLAALRRRGRRVELVLTDLHPQSITGVDGARYWPTPVDATAVPRDLRGVRTQFLALHHFSPGLLRRILADSVAAGCPFVGLEATSRSLGMVLTNAVGIAPLVVLLSPWSGNVGLVLPVVAAAVTFDGVVSCLRSYTSDELRALVAEVCPPDWIGQVDTFRARGLVMRRLLLLPPCGTR